MCSKQYHNNLKEQRNAYEKQKRKNNIRTRTNKACKSQNIKKTNKTIDLLRCSNSFSRKWVVHCFLWCYQY